jgi:C1A family cysteine protease
LEEQERIGAAAFETYKSSGAAAAIGAPAAFDWRNNGGQNYVTPIKNQGNCGSCVAFSTVAVVESMIKIQRGSGYPIDLSEAHLFYCIARSQGRTCSTGWWCEPALIAFRDIGVADEACYPYVGGDQNCTGRCSDWVNCVSKITGYTHLTSIAAMKDWISTKGPLAATFMIYQDFYSYSSGIYCHSTGSVVWWDGSMYCWL